MRVLAARLELARLFRGAREQRRADTRALEQHGNRRAKGTGADDRGASDRVTHSSGFYPSRCERLRANWNGWLEKRARLVTKRLVLACGRDAERFVRRLPGFVVSPCRAQDRGSHEQCLRGLVRNLRRGEPAERLADRGFRGLEVAAREFEPCAGARLAELRVDVLRLQERDRSLEGLLGLLQLALSSQGVDEECQVRRKVCLEAL